MAKVLIYSTTYCPYCNQAKQLLEKKRVHYKEILIDNDSALRDEMIAKTGRYTVPQIFINDQHIGGCDDIYALNRSGELDKLLQG